MQRWTRGGLLAKPTGRDWAATHLAVPTVRRRRDGRLEVYASSRDAAGRSHVCRLVLGKSWPDDRVDCDLELILHPGPPGTFDDSGAMATWVRETDAGPELYYIGWNRSVTVPFRNALGVARSRDGGTTFERAPGPVLDRGVHDPCFVASCCVLPDGKGELRMWYVSGVAWEDGAARMRPRYHIKHATSMDGITWHRDGAVCIDFASANEHAISRPCVLRDGDVYRMWYSHRGRAYRIGYAESQDGLQWVRLDDEVRLEPPAEPWESEMVAYAFVFDHRDARFMLYNGNGYGRAGIGWAVLE